ncbi:hypothetical protein CKY20_07865 [Capnocytophaga canis]|uniref:Uncharacterized protein n=1 Tax=Capnocytophaga canis TaxID=1848903 RepID=A0A3A1YGJ5_9FLAO|nr:hypothetical protein CKY20_07865 [Capnocytophaga canis]
MYQYFYMFCLAKLQKLEERRMPSLRDISDIKFKMKIISKKKKFLLLKIIHFSCKCAIKNVFLPPFDMYYVKFMSNA